MEINNFIKHEIEKENFKSKPHEDLMGMIDTKFKHIAERMKAHFQDDENEKFKMIEDTMKKMREIEEKVNVIEEKFGKIESTTKIQNSIEYIEKEMEKMNEMMIKIGANEKIIEEKKAIDIEKEKVKDGCEFQEGQESRVQKNREEHGFQDGREELYDEHKNFIKKCIEDIRMSRTSSLSWTFS